MGFIKKIWKDRISEFPTRRSLTKTDGTSELVTVARSEGMISEEGDAFSAENMNDFENRVANGFNELTEKMEVKYGTFTSSNNSIVQLQGAPNVVKYGHLVNVYFLVYLSIELNPGDVLGDLSFVPRSELSNIPIYAVDYVTSVRAINLRYTDGHTHVEIGGGNAVKSGTYAVSFSYES
jgi:hypothetical protein